MGVMAPRLLGRRLVAQSAALLVAVAFMVILPAGTIIYWQAWVYVGIFVVASTTMSIYLLRKDPELLERRLAFGERGETEQEQRRVQRIAGASFVLMLVFSAVDLRLGWSHVPFVAVVLADLLVVAGFVIVFLVFRENTFSSSIVEVVPGQQAVTTGPYRVVRHPMYAGALLLLAATPVALGSWWSTVFFLPMVVAIAARIQHEERHLTEHLPGYREYVQATRKRLIPGIW